MKWSDKALNASSLQFFRSVKGTVPPDFSPLVFLFKQLLLAPEDKPSNDFDFFSNIRGDIRLFRCIAGVNDTGNANDFITVGWFFRTLNGRYWEVISTDGLFFTDCSFKCTGELPKVLLVHQRCQRHRQCMHCRCHWYRRRHASPVSLTPAKLAIFTVRYQWHQWCTTSPVSMTLVTCFAGVIGTGKCMHCRCHWHRRMHACRCQ